MDINIQSLKFISESSKVLLYEVNYLTKGSWLNRSEEKTIQVFLEKSDILKFKPFVYNYNTGELIDIKGHLYHAIIHDYELNVNE